jgi:predicted alpha/beta-fold hydrolase
LSSYRAPWWLPGGHLQTLYGALGPAPRVAWRRERWDTPDGDFIDLDWADGAGGPLVVLFHGLEGGSSSPYARRICGSTWVRPQAVTNSAARRVSSIRYDMVASIRCCSSVGQL